MNLETPVAEALAVRIKQFDTAIGLPLPEYQTAGSAGMDIYAAVDQAVAIAPGAIALIPTGVAIALPRGYECQVRSRSGLAARYGVFTLNSPGTVDSDYRGEIRIILANMGPEPFTIERGMRIAQLVVTRYSPVVWEPADSLEATERNGGGFGSTGI